MSSPAKSKGAEIFVPEIGENALRVIEKRYSIKDEHGNPTETWKDITRRVVNAVSEAEVDEAKVRGFRVNLYPLLATRTFLPNTPCLVNAGRKGGQLAGCFVLEVPDSIAGIMKTASDTAVIHQSGGGTGFSFETLRPAGSIVRSTHGVASGPVSFMEIFDKVTDVVKQGGVRRGANMGIMRCDHPDILRFIHAKNNQHSLLNFNISVTVTDDFMEAVEKKQWIRTKFNVKDWHQPVYDPLKDGNYEWGALTPSGMLYAPDVWQRIIESAHKYAEPGIVFIDTINRHNMLKASMGEIKATNPCAEQALHSNNSCNLGSIDVAKFFEPNWNGSNTESYDLAGDFNWQRFRETIYWCVRFLDNVIDVGDWVLPEIEEVVKRTRPVGLGIMGFADLLLKMKVAYGSPESIKFLHQLTAFFQREAWKASLALGLEKGEFPEYEANRKAYDDFFWNDMELDFLALDVNYNTWTQRGFTPRNYEVTTIAPTGTISLVAETSSSIEPNFAWSFTRKDTVGTREYFHPMAAEYLEAGRPLPDYFVTAHDLDAEGHLKVLAAAQAHVDNGISKTCNGHADDTVESVALLYKHAHQAGVKAVSYYRDGSRDNQVLTAKPSGTSVAEDKKCPECGVALEVTDGCETCRECGFGKCSIS